ncbi:hypothetical protein [Microbacterium sp. C7(2022)]|uniref:hypothetical protein n=1 Tax=Microbacterium sp. C7(2022) TaxID=2992759 RepID=UPI00237A743F|nr:hypothetical protein [Microbacterium sp. C7(2022)]
MTPTTLLRAEGSPATWLINSTRDHRIDRPGEFRYLVSSLDQSAIADLAMLALEHWQVRVGRGPNGGLRVTLTRPGGKGVHASATDPSDRSLRQRKSPSEGDSPSRTRARGEAARG